MGAGALNHDAELPNPDRQRWLGLAEKALAGGSFEEKLVSHTDDGIRIEPLYDRSVTAEPLARANPSSPWIVSQRIDDPDIGRAKAQALEDVAQGATGLSLVFEGAPNAFGYGLPRTAEALETVLDGVPLNRIQVRIDAHPWSRAVADWLVAFLSKRRSDPAKLNLSFGIDPAAIFAGTGRLRMSIEALQASMPQSLAHFFSMGVPGVLLEADGRVFHNAGATEAQELGTMMASAVSYLRMFEEARQPLVYAAPHIGFALSVDQDQFVSMAKVRALRRLWARVQEACFDRRVHRQHPCRGLLPHDDFGGPGDKHPAHHDRRFCRGSRRGGFDLHPAAYDRAWPADGLCPPCRPQYATDHGQRKPYRSCRRPCLRFGRC